MAITQLDLTNRPAGSIHLPENYRRFASGASRRSAGCWIAASPDLNSGRERIEVRFEHVFVSISIRSLGGFATLSSFASFNWPVQSRYLNICLPESGSYALHEVRDRKHDG